MRLNVVQESAIDSSVNVVHALNTETSMFKTLLTIVRGRQAEAVEAFADANALTLLDQQIRDAGADLDRARRALAIARAQDGAERQRIQGLRDKIADLEVRALAALDGAREDLAAEAAEAIAGLETDLAAASAAQTSFTRECEKLKRMSVDAERRFAELERGRRAARAAEAIRRLRARGGQELGGGASALKDAEATLKRLRERQLEDEAATAAMEAMEQGAGADLVAEKLEAAGFGDATRPTAKSVLERLKQARAAAPAKTTTLETA
jgi:phage shock protein A